MSQYPEHDKLAHAIEPYVGDPVAAITEFLEWLEDEHGIVLCSREPFVQQTVPTDLWPLVFFGIDAFAYDDERRAMREEAPDGC